MAGSNLQVHLTAYSPCELSEFLETVDALLDATDNNSVGHLAIRARIHHVPYRAVEKQMKAELGAHRTAKIIPFPKGQ